MFFATKAKINVFFRENGNSSKYCTFFVFLPAVLWWFGALVITRSLGWSLVRSSSGSGLVELKYSSVVKSLFEADEYGNELFDSLPIIIKEECLKHNALFHQWKWKCSAILRENENCMYIYYLSLGFSFSQKKIKPLACFRKKI